MYDASVFIIVTVNSPTENYKKKAQEPLCYVLFYVAAKTYLAL